MQGKWVQSLVREDSTCHGATKPIYYKYELLKPMSPRTCASQQERPTATTMRSLHMPSKGWTLLAATRESWRTGMMTQHSQKEIDKPSKKKKDTSFCILPPNTSMRNYYFYVFSKCIQRVYLTFIIIKQVNMYLYM